MTERPSWWKTGESFFEASARRLQSESPAEHEAARRRTLQKTERELARQSQARRVEQARAISDLGAKWQDRTLDKFEAPPGDIRALGFAHEFVEDPRTDRGLWFHGPVGIGKTHLVAGIIIACGELGIPGTFKTAQGFLDTIKATYNREGKVKYGESDIIAGLAHIPLLALDDLDKVKFNEWSGPLFYSLVNARYEANLPLLVTSNNTPAQLGLRWAENCKLDKMLAVAIVDRMLEMCRITSVTGESYRSKIA